MPEKAIVKLHGEKITNPAFAQGVPRCEIYLRLENPKYYIERVLYNGGKMISSFQD